MASVCFGELSFLRPPELTSLRATELLAFLCTNGLTCLWPDDVLMDDFMTDMCMAGWVDIHGLVIYMFMV